MGQTFIDSEDQAQQPGVFPIEVASPLLIEGVPQGFMGLVAQFAFGPVALYTPADAADLLATFEPDGAPHSSPGYYSIMRRKGLAVKIARVLGGAEGLLPPLPPTITQIGAAGAVTYTYKIVARNAAGHTQGSAAGITTTGNATLDNTNYNSITWPAVPGATSYDVELVAAAGNITHAGLITNTASTTYLHKGGDGDSSAIPTTNTSGWKTAVCNVLNSSGVAVARVIIKWPGSLGNSITGTVAAGTDGVTNHFDFTVTLTNGSMTTSETFTNLSTIATTALPDLTNSVLLGSFALIGTPVTRPANGAVTFAGGSDGAAVAGADYQAALDLLAADDEVRVVVADDCGDSLRAAVNADLEAHAVANTNRIAVLQDNDSTWSNIVTNVGSFRSDRVIYCGKLVNARDDGDVEQLTPLATFVATALINTEANQSHAWRDRRVTKYYDGISSIPSTGFNSGSKTIRDAATNQGICLPIRLASGTFAVLHGRVTLLTANKRFATTRRIKDYIGLSLVSALDPYVNGPNVGSKMREIKLAVNDFLSRLVTREYLTALADVDIATPNTLTTIALGQFAFNIKATNATDMEKIFPRLNIGPNVVVLQDAA